MVICMAGMHRSGTSLMSSYLVRCGVVMGEEMLSGKVGNKFGLFEEREFLELHKSIIKSNKTTFYKLLPKTSLDLYEYLPCENVSISESEIIKAKSLYNKYSEKYSLWGWKDPRTSLFLDLWRNIGGKGEMKFLIMYRDPYEVIDSLCRRLLKYNSPYKYVMPVIGCLSWLRYNQSIIKFFSIDSDMVRLINISGFIADADASSRSICKWVGVDWKNFNDVYQPKEMGAGNKNKKHRIYDAYLNIVFAIYKKQLDAMYLKLESLANISSSGLRQ